jgi:hypothetical protein
MIKSEKKYKELSEILYRGDFVLISGAIELLREEQPFEGAIGLLTKCYDSNKDLPLRKSIEGFMNDLKDETVIPEIIKEVRKPWKDDTISMLISCCWQSGLNFSEYLMDFAEVFIKGDYVTAIECLTVIEESVHELTIGQLNAIIKYIEESQLALQDEKKALKGELIAILSRQ